MLDEGTKAEARLVGEVIKLAPRFVARVTSDRHPMKWAASTAVPYLISVIASLAALAFTGWERPFSGNGIPCLFAFSLAVAAVTRGVGPLPGLVGASVAIITAKLFFIPPLFQMTSDAPAAKFLGLTVGLTAIALARPTSFDNHMLRRLRRIKEAILSTRSSSTAWPRLSSPTKNSYIAPWS